MGGCAPYRSSAGMFRSSTKTHSCLPGAGPNVPLRRLQTNLQYMDILHALKLGTEQVWQNPTIFRRINGQINANAIWSFIIGFQ